MIQGRLYKPTHLELIECAKKWLHKKHSVVITEMDTYAGEIPDAIGWTPYSSTLIECKTSMSDFNRDKHKSHRRFPDSGMGNLRYYMTPKGLISPDLLPPRWGLLEKWGKTIRIIRTAFPIEYDYKREMILLISAIRRIGETSPDGISVTCYKYETKNTATLGVACQEGR